MENDTDIQREAKRHVHRFKNGLPMQISLNEISKAVGKTDGLNCLDVGVSNGMMAYHLRKLGGKWHSAVADEPTAQVVKEFVSKNVDVISGQSLPFKKKHFDVVVVADFLERVRDDNLFIEECHRILQPDGRIVITVPNSKPWTIVNPMRSILGVGPDARGWVRPGYTESELFGILKHGFDVHQMRSYGKVLMETTDTLLRAMSARAQAKENPEAALRRIAGAGGVVLRIAYQMDMLLFLGRGFKLIATAKRRTWRPRNAPILVDGRSISEAVLSRIGD
jgi:SAM-dependent methyltransferase